MNFPIALYLTAVLAAFTTALLALPIWTKWCLRAGLVDDPGDRKLHESRVPLAGGLTIITALIVPALLAVLAIKLQAPHTASETNHPMLDSHGSSLNHIPFLDSDTVALLAHGLTVRGIELFAIFIGAVAMLIVGLLDDKHELKPAAKFAGQLLAAFLVAAAGVRITVFVPSLVFSYFITILWIVTVTNAFNFVDNMNGLCGGLAAIGALYFAMISAMAGQYLVALAAFLSCGALLGFLPYNFPRAKAFLGDSGSHLAGYLLAILAILPHFYTSNHPHALAVLTPLLVLAVPLADLVWVILFRSLTGRPFYVADTNHLSHHLVGLGLSRTRAVLLLWLLAGILGALASF